MDVVEEVGAGNLFRLGSKADTKPKIGETAELGWPVLRVNPVTTSPGGETELYPLRRPIER